MTEWFYPRYSLGVDGLEARVDARLPGWRYTGLVVVDFSKLEDYRFLASGVERLVIPLAGSAEIRLGSGQSFTIRPRRSVFSGPADVVYLGCFQAGSITGLGRVAIAMAPAKREYPNRLISAEEVPVELRGAGRSSRQVHNFGTPETLLADRFIVCEVITPSENISSYPPHKHDQYRSGLESCLEEIYYFEAAAVRGFSEHDRNAFGLFTTYSSSAGQIDINARVRTGDIALVPYGYHGPAVAVAGYDLYYLNVMAGPDPNRAWKISDDPAHAWVRDGWSSQSIDPRLPFGPS